MSKIVFDIIDRAPTSLWMSNFFRLKFDLDSRNTCQRSLTNLAADVETNYMLHSIPYLGKDDFRPAGILQLIEPYKKTGRNVTTDKYFFFGKSC